ncbi:sigma-70 family RNA polymerase sigma factor [Agrobacterium rubi]|nr:sigma-70 family RNA polymerase sigma factor [Agrobacterium rubi]NTF24354.1 sigma-70 family RNA polymerase sigma factor [Agrobacterium rubi]
MVLSRTNALAQPVLPRDEEMRLIAAWKDFHAPEVLERITLAYMRVSFNIASYYSSNPEHIRDLAQEGVFGIRRALDEYDPSYGTLFSTFVRRYIQNAVADKVSAVSTDVTIPSRVLLDARAGRTNKEGSPAAFAVLTSPILFDAPVSGDGMAVSEMFADSGPTPEDNVARMSQDSYFQKLIASSLEMLTPRERTIMERRHLQDPGETLEEIGRDLGITRERVRQLEGASLLKMKRHVSRISSRSALFS